MQSIIEHLHEICSCHGNVKTDGHTFSISKFQRLMNKKFNRVNRRFKILGAEIRKYRESADRSENRFFFLFSPKEPIWLTIFVNDSKSFDFLLLYSKFAKPKNSATGPSTAAMRLEIWHILNTLVRTHQTLS